MSIAALTAAGVPVAAPSPMAMAQALNATPPATIPQPNDVVDFSLIDTPEKAAAVPILNGVMLSMLYGSLTGTPPSTAALNMYFAGTTPAIINYTANPGAGVIMRGIGNIGQSAFSETWLQQNDGSVFIEGNVGGVGEALRVSNDGPYWRLDGRIGNFEVHQKGFAVVGPSSSDNRYILDGTLGGKEFHQEIYHPANSLMARGYVGTSGIDMNMTSALQADGSTNINGQGFVAGNYVSANGILNAVPASATPPPPSAVPGPATAVVPTKPGQFPIPYAYRMPLPNNPYPTGGAYPYRPPASYPSYPGYGYPPAGYPPYGYPPGYYGGWRGGWGGWGGMGGGGWHSDHWRHGGHHRRNC